MLPSDGAALLAFKRSNEAPTDARWGKAGVALDDPLTRLAELDSFSEVAYEPEDERAAQAAAEASEALASAVAVDASLRPWHGAMVAILDTGAEEEPVLPVRVSTQLLLGDQHSAADVDSLLTAGVTHVLNCGETLADLDEAYAEAGIEYVALGAEDAVWHDMRQHVPQVEAFLERMRAMDGTCLVHCQAGINRSGFIVAYQLLVHGRRTVLDVVALLRRERGAVLWNAGFRVQLLEVARDHNLLGEPLPTPA